MTEKQTQKAQKVFILFFVCVTLKTFSPKAADKASSTHTHTETQTLRLTEDWRSLRDVPVV